MIAPVTRCAARRRVQTSTVYITGNEGHALLHVTEYGFRTVWLLTLHNGKVWFS